MANYKTLERKTANLLDRFPVIKRSIKRGYQYLNYLLYRRENDIKLHNRVSVKKISYKNKTSFWGYYDKSPEREGNILFHSCEHEDIQARSCKNIDIILNNEIISHTNTWNWQQGSMLGWLSPREIIHNFYDGRGFRAKIINIENRHERIINHPIYALSGNGEFALSLNYSRLAKLSPAYGYFNENFEDMGKYDKNDGIFFVDLKNGSYELIIDFERLINFHYREEMHDCWHLVNHIEVAPDQQRFIFLHRWMDKWGRKWSRLISANSDGSDMFLLSDENMVSHCIWKNSSQILGWMRKIPEGDGYYLVNDKSSKYEIVGEGLLSEDGHPSFSEDGKWILTDTYPDKSRMSSLLLFNMEQRKLYTPGRFFSPLRYNGSRRCDLHPRFNPDNRNITFDSAHEGKRYLYSMDISNITEDFK